MNETQIDRRAALRSGVAGVAVAAGLAGCTGVIDSEGNDSSKNGSGGGGDRTVEVVLEEWQVKPDASTIPAGNVVFNAVNRGHETHELVVRRRNDDGAFEELDEVDDVAKGTSKQLSATLEPGRYELACLIVEEEGGETEDHYRNGMHTEIEATKR